MRRLLLAATVTLLAAPAFASSSVDTMMACASAWNGMSSIDKAKTTYDAFSTSCLKAHGPSGPNLPSSSGMALPAAGATIPAAAIPGGSTGLCKDGSFTNATSHQGACSGHGGVGKWLTH